MFFGIKNFINKTKRHKMPSHSKTASRHVLGDSLGPHGQTLSEDFDSLSINDSLSISRSENDDSLERITCVDLKPCKSYVFSNFSFIF